MVRRRIEIKPIEDNSKRHTTFTKRRQGLMKKAEEFFAKTESEGAVIAFSKAGNGYVFAHPDVDAVLNRYAAESSSALAGEAGSSGVGGRLHDVDGIEEEAAVPMTEVQKRIGEAVENGRWNDAVRGLGIEELDELYAEMENIKRKVEREIAAAEKDFPEGGSSVGDSSRGCSS